MAEIILDPDEMFEHFHADESETRLLEGDVVLILEGASKHLAISQVVHIPANTAHTLHNIGHTPARLACVHAPPPRSE